MFKDKNLSVMLLSEYPFTFSNKYIYEIKFDGIRALIYVNKNTITIKSRNNIDITNFFPELTNIKDIVSNNNVIFDGEIIVLENNIPTFSKVQQRLRLKNKIKIEEYSQENPATFVAFDILYLNKSLLDKKLIARKNYLNKFRDTNNFIKSKVFLDGNNLFKSVKTLGLEGIVAKEKDSLYYPKIRTKEWIKLKNIKQDYFYIGGYIKNKASYSLLLGEKNNKKLYYVGKIKVTNNNPLLKNILKEKESKNSFINYNGNAHFIKPNIQIKINYLEKTKNNMLRHPYL